MDDHPTAKQLEQYSERSLSPEVFAVIHNHIISCVVCRDKYNALAQARQNYANLLSVLLPEPEDRPYHLSYEQVAAYVDQVPGQIDIQIAESHLEVCPQCRDDVRNLQEFKAENFARGVTQPLPQKADYRLGHRRIYWPAYSPLKIAAAIVLTVGTIALLALTLMWAGISGPAELGINTGNSNSVTNNNSSEISPGDKENGIKPNLLSPEPSDTSTGVNQASIVLIDGGRKITLDEQGNAVGLEHLSEALRNAVKLALKTQKIIKPLIIEELNDKPSRLLGESGDDVPFQLLSPIGEVILGNRPTFRWLPLKGASSYVVTITDARLNEVASSEHLTVPEWKISRPLAPGVIYSWQVTALKDGQKITTPVLPAPQARFKVLELTRAEALRAAIRGNADSHLALSVLYAQSGLLAEAEREMQSLVKTNPGSRTLRKLLRSVQSLKK
jgi:predicted anti-sigma-YlaC factor YlaD